MIIEIREVVDGTYHFQFLPENEVDSLFHTLLETTGRLVDLPGVDVSGLRVGDRIDWKTYYHLSQRGHIDLLETGPVLALDQNMEVVYLSACYRRKEEMMPDMRELTSEEYRLHMLLDTVWLTETGGPTELMGKLANTVSHVMSVHRKDKIDMILAL